MKFTDDYTAKFSIWARENRVYPMPRIANLPPFKSKKFNSYDEFNAWKKSLLDQIARAGGVQWTR